MSDVAFQFEFERNTTTDYRPADPSQSLGSVAELRFETVTTIDQFRTLRDDWERLHQQTSAHRSIFQDFTWLMHWADSYLGSAAGKRALSIVVGRTATNDVALIVPLQLERVAGMSQLSWMGHPVAQYGDVLVASRWDTQANIQAAITFAIQAFAPDLVRLRKVRDDARAANALRERKALTLGRDQAFELDFSDVSGFATYEKRYSSKSRKNRRRLLRRLKERHQVSFQRHTAGSDAARVALMGLALKRAWIRDRGLTSSALEDSCSDGLIASLAADPASGCQVYSLQCDGHIAGVQIGFQRQNRLELYLIAFDLEYEKAGIGSLHLEDTFRDACEQGNDCVDLLAPGAAYKREWADRSITVVDFVIPCTTAGRAFTTLFLDGLHHLLKWAQNNLPIAVRKPLLNSIR